MTKNLSLMQVQKMKVKRNPKDFMAIISGFESRDIFWLMAILSEFKANRIVTKNKLFKLNVTEFTSISIFSHKSRGMEISLSVFFTSSKSIGLLLWRRVHPLPISHVDRRSSDSGHRWLHHSHLFGKCFAIYWFFTHNPQNYFFWIFSTKMSFSSNLSKEYV